MAVSADITFFSYKLVALERYTSRDIFVNCVFCWYVGAFVKIQLRQIELDVLQVDHMNTVRPQTRVDQVNSRTCGHAHSFVIGPAVINSTQLVEATARHGQHLR
jgi:hypothetical protein